MINGQDVEAEATKARHPPDTQSRKREEGRLLRCPSLKKRLPTQITRGCDMSDTKLEYELRTNITDKMIIQEAFEVREEIATSIGRWIAETREQEFIDALVKLGWTPPDNP